MGKGRLRRARALLRTKLGAERKAYDFKKNLNPQHQGSDGMLAGSIWSVARGPVLVGQGEGDEPGRVKRGIVGEGGVVLQDRPFHLVLAPGKVSALLPTISRLGVTGRA